MQLLHITRNRKWSRRDTILLFERLELYTSSGLNLDKTLSVVEQGIPSWQAAQIRQMHVDILGGSLLSVSLAKNIRMSSIFTGLIKHGEHSGGLAPALGMARKLLEQQDEITKKVMSALAYPVVIGVFASFLTIGLVRGIMPQIIPMLRSLNVALPLLTRIVISISENVISYGVPLVLASIFMLGALSILYKKVRTFKKIVHVFFSNIPLVGNLVYVYSVSLFLRSCGAMIDSGISVVTAYDQAAATVSLIPLSIAVNAKTIQVSKGISLGSILADISKRIPSHVPPLLLAGEASGTLGNSLLRAADIIDRDIDHNLKRLTSLIEPVMMVAMGGVVGAIALSIMMPIYDISRVLQH